jgi:RNA polymerase sigma-70 factor (ECF subfamily)
MDLKQIDDKALIEEIKASNLNAFTELYQRLEEFLKIVALGVRDIDMELAQESVNDVLLSIWQRRFDIQITGNVRTYLLHAVKKQCAYKLRSLEMHKRTINNMDFSDLEFGFYPAAILENKELGQKIYRAIAHISAPSSRKAFEMQYLENKPQKAIAKELNLSLDVVKKKINRAAMEVRLLLKKNT